MIPRLICIGEFSPAFLSGTERKETQRALPRLYLTCSRPSLPGLCSPTWDTCLACALPRHDRLAWPVLSLHTGYLRGLCPPPSQSGCLACALPHGTLAWPVLSPVTIGLPGLCSPTRDTYLACALPRHD